MVLDTEDYVLLLMNRLDFWKPTSIEKQLFEDYYTRLADEGLFDNTEDTVMQIVDNDYVNWMQVVSKGEDNYTDAKKLYEKEGLGAYCDSFSIEAVDNESNPKHYLLRLY